MATSSDGSTDDTPGPPAGTPGNPDTPHASGSGSSSGGGGSDKQGRKRLLILIAIAVVVIALLVAGLVWWLNRDDDDDPVRGSERDRVEEAAISAVGGGTVVDVDRSDDPGEAYEVEVRLDDGADVTVTLDEDLDVVSQDLDDDTVGGAPGDSSEAPPPDDRDDPDDRNDRDDRDDRDDRNDRDDRDDRNDRDDRVLGTAERRAVERAALDAVGGGTVLSAEPSDDRGVAYEVEVRDRRGVEWNVDLDSDRQVVDRRRDD